MPLTSSQHVRAGARESEERVRERGNEGEVGEAEGQVAGGKGLWRYELVLVK